MLDTPTFGNLDIANFTVGSMLRSGLAIRRVLRDASTEEEAADRVTRFLYEHCVDSSTGKRCCALVRFYKTHAFGALPADLKRFAQAQLGDMSPDEAMRCLVLMATAGEAPEWNTRRQSRQHQAIPLPSAEAVRKAPMIARLIEDLGFEIDALVNLPTKTHRSAESQPARTYDVFYVEHARGSPHIPAQREFVERYGIESVVGFGGLLRSGELFAVILFSSVHVPPQSAARFRAIALDVRSSLFGIDASMTWRV